MAKNIPERLDWNPAGNVTTDPGSTKKTAGWQYKERPPAQYMNWLFQLLGLWTQYIQDEINQGSVIETVPASMFVTFTAIEKWNGGSRVSKADQTLGPISAPTTNQRIDLVVYDRDTLVASIVAGTEAATPVDPAVPNNAIVADRITLQTSSTTITQNMIERVASPADEVTADANQKGIVQLASNAEVVTGTNTTKAVTPAALAASRKPSVLDMGSVGVDTAIDISKADLIVIDITAAITLTFSSSLATDRATVAIKNSGSYAITIAGIDNNVPSLTAGTNVQDILGLVKSFGKITTVGLMDNMSAV